MLKLKIPATVLYIKFIFDRLRSGMLKMTTFQLSEPQKEKMLQPNEINIAKKTGKMLEYEKDQTGE